MPATSAQSVFVVGDRAPSMVNVANTVPARRRFQEALRLQSMPMVSAATLVELLATSTIAAWNCGIVLEDDPAIRLMVHRFVRALDLPSPDANPEMRAALTRRCAARANTIGPRNEFFQAQAVGEGGMPVFADKIYLLDRMLKDALYANRPFASDATRLVVYAVADHSRAWALDDPRILDELLATVRAHAERNRMQTMAAVTAAPDVDLVGPEEPVPAPAMG